MNDSFSRLWEQAVVLRCQAGDDAAFEELVKGLDGRIRRFVGGLLAGDAETEDVVQETWLDAYRGLTRLRNPKAFRVWLYRIARDKAFAALRKRKRFVPLSGDTEARDDAAEPDVSRTELERMQKGLAALAPQHREVLLLSVQEGLTYEEIADEVGCKVGTVRSRIHYAKRALRLLTMEGTSHDER